MDEMKGREARINRLVAAGLRSLKLQPDEWSAIYQVRSAQDSAKLLLALPPANPLPESLSGAQAIAPLLLAGLPSPLRAPAMFQRRQFLKAMAGGLMVSVLPNLSWALAPAGYRRLLVLIELKGGNDGLNTVVPYASADYYRLRPGIAIPREQVIPLSEQVGLHPAMTACVRCGSNRNWRCCRASAIPTQSIPFPFHRNLGNRIQ